MAKTTIAMDDASPANASGRARRGLFLASTPRSAAGGQEGGQQNHVGDQREALRSLFDELTTHKRVACASEYRKNDDTEKQLALDPTHRPKHVEKPHQAPSRHAHPATTAELAIPQAYGYIFSRS